MAFSILSVFAAFIFSTSPCSAAGLEPALLQAADHSWRMVQGGGDGNPVAPFNADMTGGRLIRGNFRDIPGWIVSEDFDGDGVFEAAVLFNDGTLRVITLQNNNLRTISSTRQMAPGVSPVVLASLNGEPTGGLVGVDDRGVMVSIDYENGGTRRIASGFSTLSLPFAGDLDGDGQNEIAAVSDEGNLTIVKGRTQTRSYRNTVFLPDTRITAADMNGDGLLEIAVFSTPVTEHSPRRLGDDLEARAVSLFNWNGRSVSLRDQWTLPDSEVFEILTPMFISGAGEEGHLLMLTVTAMEKGTQVRSYSYRNGRIREKRKGRFSGTQEWIHLLGSAVMGENGEAVLLTSLVSRDGKGELELYDLDLSPFRTTFRSSVSTHIPGSRLLETVLAGDFDKDTIKELMVPGSGGSSLMIYSLENNSLKGKEVFNTASRVTTNLCPGDFNGDGLGDILFGLDDGTLLILLGE